MTCLQDTGSPYDYSLPSSWRTDAVEAGDAPFVEEFRKGFRIGLFVGVMGGHSLPGYAGVLKIGYGGMTLAARMHGKGGHSRGEGVRVVFSHCLRGCLQLCHALR